MLFNSKAKSWVAAAAVFHQQRDHNKIFAKSIDKVYHDFICRFSIESYSNSDFFRQFFETTT
jgi:hypothetical protein